jgi:plastocyanin
MEPSTVEPGDAQVVATDTPRAALVRMLTMKGGAAGEFAPRVVRVRRGDRVQFQLAHGYAVHNVSFNWLRDDRRGVPLPADSPMLLLKREPWQLHVDLPPGTYEFACIVHVPVCAER